MIVMINSGVQVFHQTARDFLLNSESIDKGPKAPSQCFRHSAHPIISNIMLGNRCTSVINDPYRHDRYLDDPADQYACRYWILHYLYDIAALGHKSGTRVLGKKMTSSALSQHRPVIELN